MVATIPPTTVRQSNPAHLALDDSCCTLGLICALRSTRPPTSTLPTTTTYDDDDDDRLKRRLRRRSPPCLVPSCLSRPRDSIQFNPIRNQHNNFIHNSALSGRLVVVAAAASSSNSRHSANRFTTFIHDLASFMLR